MLEYAVLYCSETGNTKQVAFEIFSALPGQEKDIVNLSETDSIPDAETYFIGFFVNKGACSANVIECLEHLGGKQVALFCTCGAHPTEEYQKRVESNVLVWLESDNLYHGIYMCQGKMPIQVRKKYEDLWREHPSAQLESMLKNFDEAMLHPSEQDLRNAGAFALRVVKELQREEDDR